MKTILIRTFKNKFSFYLLLLFIISLFLHLYKLNAFVTFLGDQGRDAIIIKRILTFEHLPAIGPPTSIGQVYLGPFYYYFMAPWLLFSNFNPIGLAIGVAILSSLFTVACYIAIKDMFNQKVALFSAIFITFSSFIIQYSRFSWNPNLLPFFAFLSFYFIYKSQQKNNIIWYFLGGAFLSFSIQLHYLSLFLIPTTALFLLIKLLVSKKKVSSFLKGYATLISSFLLFSIPLVIFDLKHNFLNLNNFISLSKSSSGIGSGLIKTVYESFFMFNTYVFNAQLNALLVYIILTALILFLFFSIKKYSPIGVLFLFFIITFIGITIYSGQKFPHYFTTVYVFYFVILSYFLSYIAEIKYSKYLIFAFFSVYIYVNALGYSFLFNKGSNQIEKAKDIANKIYENVNVEKFVVTSIPQDYSSTTYRYFLEIKGKRPLEKDSLEKGDELFTVCETECNPMGTPQWDVAYFAANKQVGEFTVNNVKIYKLIRE
ncbi:MAG: glycosyltransferase family 39 protein [bacterium]